MDISLLAIAACGLMIVVAGVTIWVVLFGFRLIKGNIFGFFVTLLSRTLGREEEEFDMSVEPPPIQKRFNPKLKAQSIDFDEALRRHSGEGSGHFAEPLSSQSISLDDAPSLGNQNTLDDGGDLQSGSLRRRSSSRRRRDDFDIYDDEADDMMDF